MKSQGWCVGLWAAVLFAGCATNLERDRPFSDAWVEHNRHEREFRERKAAIRGEEGLVLIGDSQKSRAALFLDEAGKPRLRVGRGWGVDLNYSGDPEVKVNYKLKWNLSKPQWERETK